MPRCRNRRPIAISWNAYIFSFCCSISITTLKVKFIGPWRFSWVSLLFIRRHPMDLIAQTLCTWNQKMLHGPIFLCDFPPHSGQMTLFSMEMPHEYNYFLLVRCHNYRLSVILSLAWKKHWVLPLHGYCGSGMDFSCWAECSCELVNLLHFIDYIIINLCPADTAPSYCCIPPASVVKLVLYTSPCHLLR